MIGIRAVRRLPVGVHFVSIGLIVSTALLSTTDTADAARRRATKRAAHVAAYNPPSSAIVIDANSGRVLYEKDADGIRYPASITKVMTLYLLFEELEAGRMTLDTPLTISRHAASQAPSKLGLRPGSTIRVEDAIKAVVTRSANDIAVAIAENVGGNEEAFCERMTRKAKQLGMTQTQYRNPSGLPNKGQLTSARDLAILGIKIQERFPKYYAYFSTRVFNFSGQKIGNHNRLLGRVEGVDGIKTGFVNASGFNIATSVRKDGRHIVAVVMGGRTASSRDATMRELIALNLPRASIDRSGTAVAKLDTPMKAKPAVVADLVTPADSSAASATRTSASTTTPDSLGSRTPERQAAAVPVPTAAPITRLVPTPAAPLPAPRPLPVATTAYAPSAPIAAPAPAAAAETTALAYTSSEPVLAPSLRWIVGARPVSTGGTARLAEPVTVLPARPKRIEVASLETTASGAPTVSLPAEPSIAAEPAAPAGDPAVDAAAEAPNRQGWFIQIGATPSLDKAEELLDRAKRASRVLSTAEPFTEPVEKSSGTLYRARFAGLDKVTAQKACNALKRADMNCFAIKN